MKGKQDGILGIKLKSHENDALIGLIANYLPPDSFHYGKDPESYFIDNSIMFDELIDCDLLVCGGDLNSRTKTLLDFIPDVDGNVKPRTNPDSDKNSHGDHFIQFLKDKRALICNGRVTPQFNNFTFIGTRGRSVPDYIYCPHDHIQYCKELKVLTVTNIINDLKLPVPRSLPDHSIITCVFDLSSIVECPESLPTCTEGQNPKCTNQKKNIRKIDENFMSSPTVIEQIHSTILKLENVNQNQVDIDCIYSEITNIFCSEIDKLPNVSSPQSRKGKQSLRKACPFWNMELQNLWEIRCADEKKCLSFVCNGCASSRIEKERLRNIYKTSQSAFDKTFRKLKRQNKSKSFRSLAQLSENRI